MPLRRLALLGVMLVPLAGGCIARHPLTEAELARVWMLTPEVWPEAEPLEAEAKGRTIPTVWRIRQEPDAVLSAETIAETVRKLSRGHTGPVELAVSPRHAEQIASTLTDVKAAVEELKALAETPTGADRDRWAGSVARALRLVEGATGGRCWPPGPDCPEEAAAGVSVDWASGPVLQMAFAWIEEHLGNDLFGGPSGGDTGNLRTALAQAVLRLGFAVVGKREPLDLVPRVVETMGEGLAPRALVERLEAQLLVSWDEAPRMPPGSDLRKTRDQLFAWTPRAIDVFVALLRQWDRMDHLEMALRTYRGESLAAATLAVLPGREVRLVDLFVMQPEIGFRGTTRIVARPTDAETVITFVPESDAGDVVVRFQGIGYALVRGLVLPLRDAALREVRLVAAESGRGDEMVNVKLLMEAVDGEGDPRVAMVYHDVRSDRPPRTRQVFSYLLPEARYTFERVEEAP